jgi:alpha-mannosidase
VYSPDGAWGFAIFNEGKYGFDARDDRLGQTILRGPEYPRPDGLWIRQERDRRLKQDDTAPPQFADQGTFIIRFGALVHDGQAPRNPVVNQIAHEFNRPPVATYTHPDRERESTAEIPTGSLVNVAPNNVELTAWKRAEKDPESYVVRFVEMGGVPETHVEFRISAELASNISRAAEVDLLEREGFLDGANLQWVICDDGAGLCTFNIRKAEVVSILLKA